MALRADIDRRMKAPVRSLAMRANKRTGARPDESRAPKLAGESGENWRACGTKEFAPAEPRDKSSFRLENRRATCRESPQLLRGRAGPGRAGQGRARRGEARRGEITQNHAGKVADCAVVTRRRQSRPMKNGYFPLAGRPGGVRKCARTRRSVERLNTQPVVQVTSCIMGSRPAKWSSGGRQLARPSTPPPLANEPIIQL